MNAMYRKRRKTRTWSLRTRLTFVLMGLIVMSLGVGALVRGYLHYQNNWGGAVFAPYGILVGGLLVLLGIVRSHAE